MNNIAFVSQVILVTFLMYKEYYSIVLWIMAIMLFEMSYYYGNEWIYLEIIEDYPIEDCVKPAHCKFLFKRLNKLSYKDIPKEMYYGELIQVGGFLVYSIALMILIFVSEYFSCVIGAIYIGYVSVVNIVADFVMVDKRFLARHKRLNKYNFKYLFLSENEPYPKKVGKCKIIREGKWWRSNIVTVSVIETGEVKEKVLLQGKKKEGDDPVYSLYEICKVYYIV